MSNKYSSGRTSWPKYYALLLVAFLFSQGAFAQISAYAFSQSTGTYTDLAAPTALGTATTQTGATSLDDVIYPLTFPGGFSFTFNGTAYTACNISTNGFITFGATAPTAGNYTPISGTEAYAGAIAAWGRDLNAPFNLGGRTGTIGYELVGTAPNRELVIEWKNFRPVFASSTTNVYTLSFQIRLQETTNNVVVRYGGPLSFAVGSTAITGSATTGPFIGLRGANNTAFNTRTNAATVVFTSSTASTVNTNRQTFNTNVSPPGMPTSGLTYTWTAPVGCETVSLAGGTTTGTASICLGSSSTLSVTGSTSGATGLTYQWYSSPTSGGPFTLIPAATGATYVATPTSNTYYQRETICAANTTNAFSTEFLVSVTSPSYTVFNGTSYIQDFESWSSICNTTDAPASEWRVTPVTGNTSWRRHDQGASAAWSSANGLYSPNFSTGAFSARFHSYDASSGSQGSLDLYIDLSASTGLVELGFDQINTSGTDVLAVLVSTDGGLNFTQVGTNIGTATTWTRRTFNITSTSATTVIRLRGQSDFGTTDIGVDNLSIFPACVGTPTGGTAIASTSLACSGASFTINVSGATAAAGLTYQWQTSPDGFDPWTNVATNGTNATLSTSITAPTYFRRITTCSLSSEFAPSSLVYVDLNVPTECYCTPIYTTGKTAGDLISNIEIIGTTLANNSGTAQVNPAYTYFTGQPNYTGTMSAGGAYTVSVTVGVWGSQVIKAWIDYDDDGVFESTEVIGSTIVAPGQGLAGPFPPATFPISLSCNPPLGTHRMRVRDVWQSGGQPTTANLDPCNSYGFGETEDYLVTITTAVPCPAVSNVVAGAATTNSVPFTWNIGCVETAWNVSYGPVGYNPTSAGTVVPTTTNTAFVLTGLAESTSYDVYVAADCAANGTSTWVGPITVTTLSGNDNCSNAYDLSLFTSPFTGSTAGLASDVTTGCSTQTSPDAVVYITVPAGYGLNIAQTANSYDSYVSVYYGATCPGTTQITCFDDPDIQSVNWTNTTGVSQNVYWVQEGFGTGAGTYTLTWSLIAPCTGTPSAGTASSTTTSTCGEVPFTINVTGGSTDIGITYLWEVNTGSGWSSTGVTTANFTGSQLVASSYRRVTTCTTSGLSATSNEVAISMNPPLSCYCIPTTTFGCTDGDVIARVTLNTLDNNSGTGCPSGTLGYSDYTTDPLLTTTLQAGSTYGCTVYAGQYSEGYAAWIDYNDDGVFSTSERIGFSAGQVTGSGQVGVLGSSATFPITLACNPPLGQHRLRVRAMFALNGSAVTPCANNAYGEIEDYTITISQAVSCPAPSAFVNSGTTNSSASFTWNVGCVETAWQLEYGPQGYTVGTGTLSNVTTNTNAQITGLNPETNYDVYVRANCGPGDQSVWVGPVLITTGCASAPLTYTQNFDGPTADCWVIQNVTGTTTINLATTGSNPTTSPFGGSQMLFFNSFSSSNGNQSRVIAAPVTSVGAQSIDVEFWWRNENNPSYSAGQYLNEGVQVQWSTDGASWTNAGAFITRHDASLASGTAEWKKKELTLPAGTGNQPTVYVALLFRSAFGDNCFLDEFALKATPPNCVGIPNVGVLTGPATACSGQNFTLGVATPLTGYVYQWQRVTSAGWVNIPGANGSTLTTTQTVATTYRCRVTCSLPGGYLGISAPKTVGMTNGTECYCTPTGGDNTGGDHIESVELGGINNISGPNASTYTLYPADPGLTTSVAAGGEYVAEITAGDWTSSNYLAAWIDFNRNGIFETSEKIGNSGSLGAFGVATFNFIVPANASLGTSRLRVREVFGSAGVNADPCNTVGFGETEDYVVTLVAGVANDAQANATAVAPPQFPGCSNFNINLANATPSEGSGNDVWYRFTAVSNAVRIAVTGTQNVEIEVEDALGASVPTASATTTADASSTGSEIYITGGLTPGQQYWVAVRDMSGTPGTASVCIQTLNDSRCDNGPNFASLCQAFKADWTGTSSYNFSFTNTVTSAVYTASSTNSTQILLSSVAGLQYGQSYNVSVSSVFNLVDAAGAPVQVIANSNESCTITIAPQPAVNLRLADRDPVTRAIGAFISTDISVCAVQSWDWSFELVDNLGAPADLIGAQIVNTGSSSRYFRTSNIPGVFGGARYRVRIRPVFASGPGTFDDASFFYLRIAGVAPGMVVADEETTPSELYMERNTENGVFAAIYPNPSNGELVNLNLAGIDSENVNIRIMDATGRVVWTNRYVVEGALNTVLAFDRPLTSGLYMVEMTFGNEVITERMMVTK